MPTPTPTPERGETALEKRCARCTVVQPLERFYANRASKDGRQSYCKPCTYEANQGRRPQRGQLAWEWNLRNKFGITPDEYADMLAAQGGVCAVCAKVDYGGKRLAIDHDHRTGRVRGLLCRKCNMGIGLLQDDPTVLRSATRYLES